MGITKMSSIAIVTICIRIAITEPIIGISVSIGIGISRPLAMVMDWEKALGRCIKSLSDGIKPGTGSKWHSVISIAIEASIGVPSIAIVTIGIRVAIAIVGIGISIGGSLDMVMNGDGSSLSHWVQPLGDGIQAGAGSKWHSIGCDAMVVRISSIGIGISRIPSVGIGITISIAKIAIVGISISFR